MEFNYGDQLTKETLELQEQSPEDFKEFTLTARHLENIANGKEESKSVSDSQAEFLKVLNEAKHRKNMTFTLYKIVKNAILKK